jgi:homoserine O-acetyltransferase
MLTQKQKIILSKPFTTENGFVIKQPEVAFEEYGLKKGPVVLITHGGLQDYHAAGKYSENDPIPGPWDDIINEGKAIDTRQYRLICANFLGSMFGSSSPISTNPDTGKPYSSSFPEITMIDMVNFYKAFLDEMGIGKLAIMAGPSTGALQTLQMAALYPDFVEKGIAVAGSGRMTPGGIAFHHFVINLLKSDPEFNNGNYEIGKCKQGLKLVHQIARIYFGNLNIDHFGNYVFEF